MDIILAVVGEGGGYEITRESTENGGWRFVVSGHPETYSTLDGALQSTNPAWPRLFPRAVHPQFRANIYNRVRIALEKRSLERMRDWRLVCLGLDEDVPSSLNNTKWCLRSPPRDVYEAALLLEDAATATLHGEEAEARRLLMEANGKSVREWTESLWGANSPYVTVRSEGPGRVESASVRQRMPTAAMKKELHRRDGYHCRYCGVPVIRKEVRAKFCLLYPDLPLWGPRNGDQHAAFQAMWAQYDHVDPHSAGGGNDLENLAVSCAPCNFAKWHYSLSSLGLADPRTRPPPVSPWTGLEQVLSADSRKLRPTR